MSLHIHTRTRTPTPRQSHTHFYILKELQLFTKLAGCIWCCIGPSTPDGWENLHLQRMACLYERFDKILQPPVWCQPSKFCHHLWQNGT